MSLPPSSNPRSSDSRPPLGAPAADEYVDPGARAIDLSQRPVADSLREIIASSPRLPQQMPPPLPPPPPVFANRHWTLSIMGLVQLALAFFLAGTSVWHVVTGGWHGLAQDEPERARLLIVNGVWTVGGLVLGLGLILARRWARALVLAQFLNCMVWTLLSAVAIGVNNAPHLAAKLSPYDSTPAWEYLAGLAGLAAVSWLCLALLGHRHVRMTCEQAQPRPDWTDRRALPELLLVFLLVDQAANQAGLATYHAWPCWGAWCREHIPWAWGGAAAVSAGAALLVACGRATGSWLALVLAAASASSVAVTALRQPVDEFSQVWGGWALGLHGGLAYTLGEALLFAVVAGSALRGRRRRSAAPVAPREP